MLREAKERKITLVVLIKNIPPVIFWAGNINVNIRPEFTSATKYKNLIYSLMLMLPFKNKTWTNKPTKYKYNIFRPKRHIYYVSK